MTKKIFAVLLAICMIASTCVLFASAADLYYVKKDASGGKTFENLKSVTKETDFDIPVEITAKTSISLSAGMKGKDIDASTVDKLFTFKAGTKTVTFEGELSKYFDAKGTVSDNTSVTFSDKTDGSNDVTVYLTDTALTSENFDSITLNEETTHSKYVIKSANPAAASVSKWVTTLASLTMGVRFQGSTYQNLVADEIAYVTAHVTRNVAGKNNTTISRTDVVKDMLPGDTAILVTNLYHPEDKDSKGNYADGHFYKFNCWVDGNGNVVDGATYDDKLGGYVTQVTMDGSSVSIYALYTEVVDRCVITYHSKGEGTLNVISDTNKDGKVNGRDVYQGDAQISVLKGKDFKFEIVPKDGYEIAHVYVKRGANGTQVDIASFSYLVIGGNLAKNIAELISATGVDRKIVRDPDSAAVKGTYTFEKVEQDCWIDVVFQKIENFEVPSGLDLPLAELGMELEGGPEGAEGAGAEGGAAAATTVPAENGVAAAGSAVGGVVNPATGSESAVAVFAVMTAAVCAAFVTMKKKRD